MEQSISTWNNHSKTRGIARARIEAALAEAHQSDVAQTETNLNNVLDRSENERTLLNERVSHHYYHASRRDKVNNIRASHSEAEEIAARQERNLKRKEKTEKRVNEARQKAKEDRAKARKAAGLDARNLSRAEKGRKRASEIAATRFKRFAEIQKKTFGATKAKTRKHVPPRQRVLSSRKQIKNKVKPQQRFKSPPPSPSPKLWIVENDKKRMRELTAVVTGATGAIGKRLCIQLLQQGVTVIPACRTIEKCKNLKKEILTSSEINTNETDVKQLLHLVNTEVNVSSAKSVQSFVSEVKNKFSKGIAILINCAAIASSERVMIPLSPHSNEKIELQFAVNVLGYFHFMLEMQPLLKLWSNNDNDYGYARIINIASNFAGYLNLSDLHFERRTYSAGNAYQQSKAANRMLSWIAARRFADDKIIVHACHPGVSPSALSKALGFEGEPNKETASQLAIRTANEKANAAAESVLYLALSNEEKVKNPGPQGAWWERKSKSALNDSEKSISSSPVERKHCTYAAADRIHIAEKLWEKVMKMRQISLNEVSEL
eukprot:g5987.t1